MLRVGHAAAAFALAASVVSVTANAEPPTSTEGAPTTTEGAPSSTEGAPATAPSSDGGAPAPPLSLEPPPETVTQAAPFVAEAPSVPDTSAVSMKLYGDTLFQVLNHGPVKTTFAAAHLDLFFTADVGKVSFLSEVFLEGREDNAIALDVERLQVSYLVGNWLRVRAGRTHTAFGYYMDTYHHGNLFELTTQRPLGVGFEDEGGLIVAHLVGAGGDGTFSLGKAGALRYDAEVGNGRLADITTVAIVRAGKTEKMLNLRLRWLTPLDGLAIGVNGIHDLIPAAQTTATAPSRTEIAETVGGAHAYYMEHQLHLLAEGYAIHHASSGGGTTNTFGGFTELGYTIGQFTPYVRPEYIRFPKGGDPVFQEPGAFWEGSPSAFDLRVGVRWLPFPQLALKLEGERIARGTGPQELLTTKLAFGF